jgi:hypothetical protein
MKNNSAWASIDANTFLCPDGRIFRWDALPGGMKLGHDVDEDIAIAIGCSAGTVKKKRRSLGIKMLVEHRGRHIRHGKYTDNELRRQNEAAARRRAAEVKGDFQAGGGTLRSSAYWMGDVSTEILAEQRNIDGSLRRRPLRRTATPAG